MGPPGHDRSAGPALAGPPASGAGSTRSRPTGFTEAQAARERASGSQAVRAFTLYSLRAAFSPSSFDRFVAASTAAMSAARNPCCSSAWTPAIDVPPGLVTWSLRRPG